jgi:hypothetical protein
MSATEPLCHLIGINPSKLTKEEIQLLEAELFVRICEELKEFFREQNRDYFHLMKFNTEKENDMLESKFVRLIIQDILSTEEYNLNGIAYYTNTHEDVVDEVLAGRNTSPSATFLRRVIELHRSVRRDLYHSIIKKIATQYMAMT